jgi:hypothetical protein
MPKSTNILFFISLIFFLPGFTFLACKKEPQVQKADSQAITTAQPRTSIKGKALTTNGPTSITLQLKPSVRPLARLTAVPSAKNNVSLQSKQPLPSTNKNLSRNNEKNANTLEPLISQDNELFISLNATGVLFPEDFKIGPVLNTYQMRSDQIKISGLVNTFFNALMKKEINKELIEKHRRDLLCISLDYYLKSDLVIKDFRLGAIQTDNTDVSSIKVRIFNNKTASNGYVYLIKEGESWLITDVQLNFLELAEAHDKTGEKFKPSIWSDYDY